MGTIMGTGQSLCKEAEGRTARLSIRLDRNTAGDRLRYKWELLCCLESGCFIMEEIAIVIRSKIILRNYCLLMLIPAIKKELLLSAETRLRRTFCQGIWFGKITVYKMR
jgi:hypothetical protein